MLLFLEFINLLNQASSKFVGSIKKRAAFKCAFTFGVLNIANDIYETVIITSTSASTSTSGEFELMIRTDNFIDQTKNATKVNFVFKINLQVIKMISNFFLFILI
jgi:hypothetical protein